MVIGGAATLTWHYFRRGPCLRRCIIDFDPDGKVRFSAWKNEQSKSGAAVGLSFSPLIVIVSVAVLSDPWPSLAANWNDRVVLSPTPKYL